MAHSPVNLNTLKDSHLVTLIMRLRFDDKGQLSDGELIDTEGSLTKHFKNRPGLDRAVDRSLQQLSELFTSTTPNSPIAEEPQKADSTRNPG